MPKPIYAKNQDTRLAGIERDIRFLKRREQIPNGYDLGGGTGILFDTHPQDGGWLYAETTDATGSPNSWGIELNDSSPDGIWIHSDASSILMTASTSASLSTTGGSISTTPANGVVLSGAAIRFTSTAQSELVMSTAGTVIEIPVSGGVFEIKNSSGTSLFKVQGDGTITP